MIFESKSFILNIMNTRIVDHLTDEEVTQQEVMWELSSSIPLNRFELPRYLYRLDYLPYQRRAQRLNKVETEAEADAGADAEAEEHDPQFDGDPSDTRQIYLPREDDHDLDLAAFEDHQNTPEEEESWFDLVPSDQLPGNPPESDETVKAVAAAAAVAADPSSSVTGLELYALTSGFTADELANARVILRYDTGYPTLPSGMSLWSRMDWEPPEAHTAFSIYLAYAETKESPRVIAEMPKVLYEEAALEIPLERVQLWHDLYYWSWRAAAYDAFVEQEYRYRMAYRMRNVMDNHYNTASRLLSRLLEYMDDEEEFWDLMNPRIASDLLSKLTALQRVSAGLPATAPLSESGGRYGSGSSGSGSGSKSEASVSIALRSGRGSAPGSGTSVIDLGGGQSLEAISDEALSDPETASLFQELIIKLSTGSTDGQ